MRFAALFFLGLASGYFVPAHRVTGIGLDRDDLSTDMLEVRKARMVESQTFAIMREPQALSGAKRITTDPKLRAIFRSAASSGFPAQLVEAIAYLESWGDPLAESPSGPKGIMQVSEGTARLMGLKIVRATRYKVTRERVPLKSKGGKARFKTVTRRTPYTVTVRDDRLVPAQAIPAAARYLAGMEQKFGGQDWAIFAYHCGQGCVGEMIDLTRHAHGIPKDQVGVPRMFFSASPVHNRELYLAVSQQMQRDYSPTYYFRVLRAAELLDLYRRDPAGFAALQQEYKNQLTTGTRAPHRLSVWIRRADLRSGPSPALVAAPDKPEYFGYSLKLASGAEPRATTAALGTLAYIAYETRRMYDDYRPKGGSYQPLPVTLLMQPEDASEPSALREGWAHASGQVFDIDFAGLPPGELECLRFVLDDLGWDGYLGFVEEGRESLHIGCSPSSRDFFASVYEELLEQRP